MCPGSLLVCVANASWGTGYQSLAMRKEQRENAWRKPGWDEVVAYTVPLIEEYHTRILYPNGLSPTQ